LNIELLNTSAVQLSSTGRLLSTIPPLIEPFFDTLDDSEKTPMYRANTYLKPYISVITSFIHTIRWT